MRRNDDLITIIQNIKIMLFSFCMFTLSACNDSFLINQSEHISQSELVVSDQAIEAGGEYQLSKRELVEAQEKRKEDAGKYAFSIYMHMVMGWGDKNISPKTQRYWLDLAADQGHTSAIQHCISSDLAQSTIESCQRVLTEIKKIESTDPKLYQWLIPSLDTSKITNCKNHLE